MRTAIHQAFRAVQACMALAIALCVIQPAHAQHKWQTVGDGALEGMRGGFAVAPGLMVSFGIVRTVRIDGTIVSHTSIQVDNLRNLSTAQARQLAEQLGRTTVVRNGPGNVVQVPGVALGPGLVIQNTESNRSLQAVTELNVVSNGMTLLQGMNLHQTLSDALKGALGQ